MKICGLMYMHPFPVEIFKKVRFTRACNVFFIGEYPQMAYQSVSTKVSRAIGFLKHAKTFLRQETLKTLYTGIVEPHFRYCCSVWGCAGSTELTQLQKLQNRAARNITNSSFDTPSRSLIDKLGWKTIEQLIASESKIMVFKSLHELAPQYLRDLFTRTHSALHMSCAIQIYDYL